MCTCAAAKRRRKQAKKHYLHLAPLVRPRYRRRDAEKSRRLLQERIDRERRIQQNRGRK